MSPNLDSRRVLTTSSSPSAADSTTKTVLEESGALNTISMLEYTGEEIGSTFAVSKAFSSAEAFEKSLIVILLFSVLWTVGMGLVLFGVWRSHRMKDVYKKRKEKLPSVVVGPTNASGTASSSSAGASQAPVAKIAVRSGASGPAPASSLTEDQTVVKTLAIQEKLLTYIQSVFPAIFYNDSFFSRCVKELQHNHSYFLLFMNTNGEYGDMKRILNGVKLLTLQSGLMCLLAILYDLQEPNDDGSCPRNKTRAACLDRRSIFDSSQT
jgi:hypothetical protein